VFGTNNAYLLFPIPSKKDPLEKNKGNGANMLWTIAILFVLLWALGLISSYTFGGFIHLLIALAVVLFLVRIIQGTLTRRRSGTIL